MLFLDHDIFFLFLDNIEKIKKTFSKVLNTFENIMENGAFVPKEQCSIFHNIFKYMIFQRRQKALLWSIVLKEILGLYMHSAKKKKNMPTKCSNAQHLVDYSKNNCSMKKIKNRGMSCNSLWIPAFVV